MVYVCEGVDPINHPTFVIENSITGTNSTHKIPRRLMCRSPKNVVGSVVGLVNDIQMSYWFWMYKKRRIFDSIFDAEHTLRARACYIDEKRKKIPVIFQNFSCDDFKINATAPRRGITWESGQHAITDVPFAFLLGLWIVMNVTFFSTTTISFFWKFFLQIWLLFVCVCELWWMTNYEATVLFSPSNLVMFESLRVRWEVIHLTGRLCRPAPSFRPARSSGATCPRPGSHPQPTWSPPSHRTTLTSAYRSFRPPLSSCKVSPAPSFVQLFLAGAPNGSAQLFAVGLTTRFCLCLPNSSKGQLIYNGFLFTRGYENSEFGVRTKMSN